MSTTRPPALTTTSYAILGLLAVKPWTTHELVRQVDRTLRRFWPRASSKLYEEPKKLVAHGLARATDSWPERPGDAIVDRVALADTVARAEARIDRRHQS